MNKLDKRIADLPNSLSHLLEKIDDLNAQWLLNNSISRSMISQPDQLNASTSNLDRVAPIDSIEISSSEDVANADNA